MAQQNTPPADSGLRAPIVLLAVVAVVLVGLLAWWFQYRVSLASAVKQDGEKQTSTQVIHRRLVEPIPMGGQEVPGMVWLAVVVPILLLGLFYIGWMYIRDAHSIGAVAAVCLGLMRCMVYLILSYLFFLPAVQHLEESRSHSRVVLLFDSSLSMLNSRDDIPDDTRPFDKLPTRQDKVLTLLDNDRVTFIKKLEDKNPVYAYRFGRQLDEDFTLFTEGKGWSRQLWEESQKAKAKKAQLGSLTDQEPVPEGKPWALKEWTEWLKPDLKAQPPEDLGGDDRDKFLKKLDSLNRLLAGTNLGESVLTAINRESNNMLQGIVIFTDGHSTEGTEQAYAELAERAKKAKVPIFVVAVGEDRPRIRVEVADVRVPDQARPDDKFKTAVEVVGEGLPGKEFDLSFDVSRALKENTSKGIVETPAPITLVEVTKSGQPTDRKIVLPNKITLKPPARPKFNEKEVPPRTQVEFQIDPASLAKAAGVAVPEGAKLEFEVSDKPGVEDEMVFVARVPRQPKEIFEKPEHTSDKAVVKMVKRPIRILLFTSGAQREYQFLRTLLVREVEKRRAELCIYLQPAPGQDQRRPGIVADVPPERLLTAFPYKLQDEVLDKPDEKFYNLSGYDAIIAFDPDWTKLTPEQLKLVEKWVGTHGGGLICVAGPVNTLQLARPGVFKEKLNPILTLYPVVPQDIRIQEERTATDPWRLKFPGANPEMEFLNLEEDVKEKAPLPGWAEFFNGSAKGQVDNTPPVRGFFNYYPVERAKEGATVVATFADPRARLADLKEQPYLVIYPYGAGKTVWLGSGEMWRLRQYREAFHERFWTKLMRYAGSGNTGKSSRRILPFVGRQFNANNYVRVEAQAFGLDMNPLPQNSRPKVKIIPPQGSNEKEQTLEMTPKPGQSQWNGYFESRFLVRSPGDWNLEFKVEETGSSDTRKFAVKESNPEVDQTKPDVDQMYWLASDASEVLGRVDEATQKELRARLVRPRLTDPNKMPLENPEQNKEGLRLYFDLSNAELIPECMVEEERKQTSKGAIDDLWDDGETPDRGISMWVLTGINILLGVLTLIIGIAALMSLAQGKKPEVAAYLLFTLLLLVALVPLQMFFWYYNMLPVTLSIVMVVVVMLLAMEWLCRKLLRLA